MPVKTEEEMWEKATEMMEESKGNQWQVATKVYTDSGHAFPKSKDTPVTKNKVFQQGDKLGGCVLKHPYRILLQENQIVFLGNSANEVRIYLTLG